MKHRLPSRLLLAGLVAALFASTSVHAQDATLDRARQMLDTQRGQGKGAYELLAPLEQARAGEPRYDYLLGLAAIDAGEFTRAVFALERVLAVEPNHPQARAEIARAYFLMGENRTARAEFEAVKASRPPGEVVATIDRFLNALDAREAPRRSGWSGYLEAGVGYDTNANAASGATGFAIPALPAFVFNGGRRHDSFLTLGGGVSGRHVLSNAWQLFANANLFRRYNSQVDAADIGSIGGDVGAAYLRGDHEVSAAVQVQQFEVDNRRFREAFGGVLQWRYTLSQTQQVSAYAQWTRLTYPNQPNVVPGAGVPMQTDRNADRMVVGGAWVNSFSGQYTPTVFAGAYIGEEKLHTAAYPEFGHKLFGVRVGGQVNLNQQTNVFATLSYEDRRYGYPASGVNLLLFPYNRLDREWNARLGANYNVSGNWTVSPALAVTENQSNVVSSAYRRTVTSVTLRYDFR
ncbi:MAG: tetratricopeptide repeat protein [Burkholderiales bacterium]|nr:tetratricopeptide repeat protein [Burkholderiales bacterium]